MTAVMASPPDRQRGGQLTTPRALPDFIGRPGPTAWHRLNPLTKVVVATSTTVAAIVSGGPACTLSLGLVAVVLPAIVARVLPTLLRTAFLLALPLALSASIVNILFLPSGADVLAELGPLRITAEGLAIAVEVVARVLVMAGAVTLLYLTTRPAELVADLEARGVPARVTFIVAASVAMLPTIVERAGAVSAAQRARGLDTEGSLVRRLRGIVPLVAPTLLGAVADVEARTMALEARAFTRPGRRALLWTPPDGRGQRLARFGIAAAVVALIAARLLASPLPC